MKSLVFVANYNQCHEIQKFLGNLSKDWPKEDTIIVDDGSTDGSDRMAEDLGYKVIRHGYNRGVGAAIRTGIDWARQNGYEVIIMMSSNGKMRTSEIKRVIDPVLNGDADYVTGNRFIKGGGSPGLTLFRRLSIPLFSVFSSVLLGRVFSDITCGFRAYKMDFLFSGGVDISQEWLNGYEMEYYIHYYACKKHLRISQVPVTIQYGHLGKGRVSKIKPFSGWWQMIRPFILLRFALKK